MKTVMEDRSYQIGDEALFSNFIKLLEKSYSVVVSQESSWRIQYLDTFDWRVWRRGGVLEYRESKSQRKLRWRVISSQQMLAEFPIDECPDFLNDISDWLLPDELLEITRPRCLLSQALSRANIQQHEIQNRSGKVVARLNRVNENLRHANNRSGAALPDRLEVLSVRGYEEDYQKILDTIEQSELQEYGKDPLLLLLQINERRPCDYSLRLKLQIDPQQRADRVSKQILLQLLNIMQQNEAGICDDMDTEFLHDFRHALHRSHSLSAQLKNILPKDTLERFDKDLVWLEHETRYLYELNHWLLDFEDTRSLLGKKFQAHLDNLMAWIREQRHAELLRVVAILKGQHYQKFAKRWGVFLECEVPEHTVLKWAAKPVSQVAGKQLWQSYKKLEKMDGDSFTEVQKLDELHRASRVLYDLLEFSRSLYSSEAMNELISLNERLLIKLRRCRQISHRVKSLRGFIQSMRGEDRLDKPTGKALEKLIGKLESQHEKCQGVVLDAYQGLVNQTNKATIKQILKTGTSD